MDNNEYLELKKREMSVAMETIKAIDECEDKLIKYRESRPITDLKMMLEGSSSTFPQRPAFWVKKSHKEPYTAITYAELQRDVNGLGTGLISMGMKGKRIAVIGANSYKWAESYLAVVCGTGIVVPLDKELSPAELKQLVIEAEVSCVIMGKKHKKDFLEMMKSGDTKIELLINMDADEDEEDVLAFTTCLNKGKELLDSGDKSFTEAQIIGDEMSILLFTSGTTGIAKGVMLSHRNICEDLMIAPTVIRLKEDQIFFSVLPLHHTYECTCGFLMPLYKGAAIAYCEGLKYILSNMQEIKPTYFLGVPAIFEMFYKKIWSTARKNGKEEKLKKAIKISRFAKKFGIDLTDKLFKDIKNLFGGRMHIIICGGAAINPDVLNGFMDFGITAVQGYGLTEAAPMGALNPDTAPNSNSVGIAFPNTTLKVVNPDENGIGEICIKGANIMMGYYKRPDLTEEVLKDGWFHTGDLGYIDEKGYVFLTGRKKNVIITKNGKNVFPEELEYYLNNVPGISESMVFSRDGELGNDIIIVASVRLDDEEIEEKFGKDADRAEIEKYINEEVDKINEKNPLFKQIKHVHIREEEFIKNTSQKIKRFEEGNKAF